jgi:GMP synthase PP-ATPase subunit
MKKLFDRISQPGPGLGIRISEKKPLKFVDILIAQ